MSCNTDQGSTGEKVSTAGEEGALAAEPRGERAPLRSWLGGRLDRAGVVWAALCALHCTAPLAVAGAALVTGAAHEHGHHAHRMHDGDSHVQLALTITSVALTGLLLGRSYLLKHRNGRPLGMFAVAVAALVLGVFVPWRTETASMSATAAGFAGLVAAQLVNIALVRRSGGSCAERRCC